MFILLKFLLSLFRPLIWILALFVFASFTKNPVRKKWAIRLAVGALFFFTNPFIINQLIKAYELEPVQFSPSQRFKTGILLGGLVTYSPGDEAGYFNTASDRFLQTALLYKQGSIENIIIAAGNGYATKNDFTEAAFIKENLVKMGIPAEKIFTETRSRNTLENALFTKQLADSVHIGGPYLLISSAMHLRRAVKVFQKVGIEPTLYPCHFLSRGDGNNLWEDYLLPSSESLTRWDNLIKELLGRFSYAVTGKS